MPLVVEFSKFEWCSIVHSSFFGIWFGHGLKSLPNNVIVAHFKKGKRKELKEKTSVPLLFFLQTLLSFQWSPYIASSTMNWKCLECCEILDEHSRLFCLSLSTKIHQFEIFSLRYAPSKCHVLFFYWPQIKFHT